MPSLCSTYARAVMLRLIAALATGSSLAPFAAAANPSSITVTMSTTHAYWGQQIKYTATITGFPGTVTFYDSAEFPSGKSFMSYGSQVEMYVDEPRIGAHQIYATFSGNAVTSPSTSSTVTVQVDRANTSTTITSPAAGQTGNPGQDLTITALVEVLPPSLVLPGGTMDFFDSGTPVGSAPVGYVVTNTSAKTSVTLKSLSAGQHFFTARFTSFDSNYEAPSVSPGVVFTVKQASNTAISASGTQAVWSEPVTLTASVSPAGAGGTVTFYIYPPAPVALGPPVPVVNGRAQLTTRALTRGDSPLFASYSGDSTYGISSSAPLTVTVNPAASATSITKPAPNSSFPPGQTAAIEASVTLSAPATGLPVGTIEFQDNGAVFASAATTASEQAGVARASVSRTLSSPGQHTLTARFTPQGAGTATAMSTGSTSAPVAIGVKTAAALDLTCAPAAASYGEEIVCSARVPAAATGEVKFQEGATTLDSAVVAQGAATLRIRSLSVGTHQISALYSGDNSLQPAAATASVAIRTATPAVRLTSSIDASGRPVLTAEVAPQPERFGAPAGSVRFRDAAGASMGTASLVNGVASAAVSATDVMRSFEAVYSGDANFSAATSARTPAVTNAASFDTSAVAPDSAVTIFGLTLPAGGAASSLPLPVELGGVSIRITDAAGATRAAPLFGVFASAGQINFLVPGDTAPGLALANGVTPAGALFSTVLNVTGVAPAIFTANADGRGAPSGTLEVVSADGQQRSQPAAVFDAARATWVPAALDLGAETDQAVLVLYGTGFRHATGGGVKAVLNGIDAAVLYAGEQPLYPGLDQLNLRLPHSLGGAGNVVLTVTVEGQTANPVAIEIR